jgi:periplasmic protein TonB
VVPNQQTNDRTFWIALAGATLLHAMLIFGAYSSPPRHMGEPDGVQDAISVDILDPEALSDSTAAQASEASPQQNTSNWSPTLTNPDKADQKDTKPDADAKPDTDAKPDKPQELALAEELPGLPRPVEPEKRKAAPSTTAPSKAKPAQPLDLSLPPSLFKPGAAGGGTSEVTRPAGITRSGENDDFGRDVIRALRRTMPPHRNIFGRVTVRFFLSANGDLVNLELLRSSGIASLDQEVMFAARTSTFPIPPKNSPPVDRTFTVTYVYG